MEPRDLHLSQMAPTVNPKSGQGISSRHPGGATVIYADGSRGFLRDRLPAATVRAILTIRGGEPVSADDL